MRDRELLLVAGALAAGVMAIHGSIKEPLDLASVQEFSTNLSQSARWIGKYAPDFTLLTLQGRPYHLADSVGKKVILLNFFATWCAPCKEEIPVFNRYARQITGQPIELIGVDAREDAALVGRFVKDLKVEYSVALDPRGDVLRKYGVENFPTTVVIGADGRVKLYEMGAILNTDVAFAALLKPELEILRRGGGVPRESYLAGASRERYGLVTSRSPKQPSLTGRALTIASEMTCPCGCTSTVLQCSCDTATKIKSKLKEDGFGEKSDAELIRDLDRQYCVMGGQ
jgi:thiol-disulfide isomerase/thioredoxin